MVDNFNFISKRQIFKTQMEYALFVVPKVQQVVHLNANNNCNKTTRTGSLVVSRTCLGSFLTPM